MLRKKSFLLGSVIVSLWFFYVLSIFSSNTDILLTRLSQMDQCFKDKQIPCRWVIDWDGYGSPFFNYHPPLVYYFGELIFLLTNHLNLSMKLMLIFYFLAPVVSVYFLYKFWDKLNIRNFLLISFLITLLITSYTFAFAIFLPGILIGIAFSFFKKRKIKFIWFYLGSLLLGFMLSAFYILPLIFEKKLIHQGYLPVYAKEHPVEQATQRYKILTGDTLVYDYKEGSNWISFKTETKTHSIIRLSQYYFPEWKVEVDGKPVIVEYKDNSLGLMTLLVGVGNHTIEAKLHDTPIRTISNFISIVVFSIATFLLLISFRRVRRWILYYRKRID